MFPPISDVLILLFFVSTLPNGIRLNELPAEGDSVEILAGYTSGGLIGFASTPAARTLLSHAYAVGAKIDLIEELDRTALRITGPKWALPMLADGLPALFKEVPADRSQSAPAQESDFTAKVESEIRAALVVPSPPVPPYATDEAFVLISAPAPNSLREALAEIPKRAGTRADETINRLPAERTLRFKSDLPAGGVIFASPIPGVYYKQWYSMLLLDRVIRRIVPLQLKTALPLTVRPYYYRLEFAVPAGQFPEPAEENLLQEILRLQFTPANVRDLTSARQEALAYLESKPVREWFASHDLLTRRDEGMQWIQSMSADDMRIAARDLLIMNRVIASWSPKPRQTSVTSEPLSTVGAVNDRPGRSQSAPTAEAARTEISLTPFPPHMDAPISTVAPERLPSGVSIVASTATAIFVSGGPMTRYSRDLTTDDLRAFQQYRAERILVLTPASSMDRTRQLWNTFRGSTNGDLGVPRGKVSGGDLPALFVLKTFLDLKLIESGWWRDVSIRIDAGEGSGLQIQGAEEKRAQILDWVKAFVATPPADAYFDWAREVAIHQFDNVRADLQALTWERDPLGTIQGLEAVSTKHVQDVARIYF